MNDYVDVFVLAYDNTLAAFNPQMWANESIMILQEQMVASRLVHTDFAPLFAKQGEYVNTRKPGEFAAKRKDVNDNVTIQDATATNVQVPLDQHIHTSFLLRDGEEAKSFKNLVEEYLRPATLSMAQAVDKIVLGQAPQFIANQYGAVGGLSASNGVQYVTGMRGVMNRNKAHVTGRNLILGADAETLMLQNPTFHQADRLGDEGTALREASLGRKFGFDMWMGQNIAESDAEAGLDTIAVDNAAGYAKGATVLTVDGDAPGGGECPAGKWISVGGAVYHVSAVDASPVTSVTLEYGLVAAVSDDDVITIYPSAAVDNASGYAAGWAKEIAIDSTGSYPLEVGRMVTFGATAHRYTVIETNGTTSMLLDRPLVAALSDDDAVHYGPSGGMNFAFHRNALTLVIRPLDMPRDGTGAASGLAMFNDLAMRAVITYDGEKQGHLVTLDFLLGIKVLDTALGGVLLS